MVACWAVLLGDTPDDTSAVADLLSCRVQDDDDEDMLGQTMVGQAVPGTLASGNGNDNTDSQVVLGVANVHVDSVLL